MLLYSIGSKPTRKKVSDPYPLDTIFSSRHNSQYVTGNVSPPAEWESTKQLVKEEQPSGTIMLRHDWDVEYVQPRQTE
jgi:hypothetical protein